MSFRVVPVAAPLAASPPKALRRSCWRLKTTTRSASSCSWRRGRPRRGGLGAKHGGVCWEREGRAGRCFSRAFAFLLRLFRLRV